MHFIVNIIFLITVYKFREVFSLPDIMCPQFFEYVEESNGHFGKLTLSTLPLSTVKVDVKLAQEGDIPSEPVGSLLPELPSDVLFKQLKKGEPIKFNIQFPSAKKPSKLLRIAINGNEICSAPNIPPPNYIINLQYTIQSKLDNIDEVCGRENLNQSFSLTPFIYNGIPIMRGEFPWLSAIYSKISRSLNFICGGSLISRRTVISAAHCFLQLKPENVIVYLGRYNLDDFSEDGYVARGLENMLLHPKFKKNFVSDPDADIAILQLDTAIQYTPYISPICLWSEPGDIDEIAGKTGTVAGWGSQGNDVAVSSLPRKVDINIASKDQCLRYSELFRRVGTDRTFCAGNGNDTGPCSGDSGSGFMIQREGVWMLRGVVSAGRTVQQRCNLKEYVIYCDVAKHLDWVKENLV